MGVKDKITKAAREGANSLGRSQAGLYLDTDDSSQAGPSIEEVFKSFKKKPKTDNARKYKVITLCGSTRFKDEFMEAQKRLTLAGNIVISVGLFGHSGDDEVWENMDEGTLTKTKEMLDDMHKRKIDMSDGIYVINVGGYIGDSTRSEIEYAIKTGKTVEYLVQPAE